jgi:AcrR family transcriptional regulator
MRVRILEGAFTCWARDGVDTTTLEDVAGEADVARATIYRHFPGGRDELLQAVVSWEVGRYFSSVADDVVGSGGDSIDASAVDSFAEWVEATLAAARRRLDQHEVLNTALRRDAGQVVPALHDLLPIVLGMLREQVADRMATLPPDVLVDADLDVDEAADFVARMMISFIGTPGSWQVDDPQELRRLVRHHLLAGILGPGPTC